MILLMDNYDSFSYNLYQLIGKIEPDIRVIRNDACTPEEMEQMKPDALILSPGPGRPCDAGICEEAVLYFAGKIPILGVCLGHQAICEVFGGVVSYAKELMHGKPSEVWIDTESPLFLGMEPTITAARYHSLCAISLPPILQSIAHTKEGEVMAVSHTQYPIFGLQFHPESIMTPSGGQIIQNFMEVVRS